MDIYIYIYMIYIHVPRILLCAHVSILLDQPSLSLISLVAQVGFLAFCCAFMFRCALMFRYTQTNHL